MAKVIVLAAVIVLARSAPARADDKVEEAKAHVKTGMELYDENNFRAALVEFQRAYELAPSYKIMFNIAQVQMELQDYAGALKAYMRYLKEGGPDVPPERVTQITADIERLRGRVGTVTIQTSAGAQVLVDDVAVGYGPLPEPVPVNAGQHRITVRPQSGDALTRVYDVAGHQDLTVSLAPDVKQVTTPPPPPPVKPTEPQGPPSKTPVYVMWGVTGALGIGAGVFAVLARQDSNKLGTLRDTYPVMPQQLTDQRDKATRDAMIADVLLGATLVSAGVATYFTITRRNKQQSTEKVVRVQAGLGSIAIAGTF